VAVEKPGVHSVEHRVQWHDSMEDTYIEHDGHGRHRTSGGFMGAVDSVFDFFVGSLRTIARDAELFIGVALTLVGLLSFHSDKFCDGNTADYLSCTRPSTYYYYSPLAITIVVLGVFLILIWFRRAKHRA
jgi:hypothetical protein